MDNGVKPLVLIVDDMPDVAGPLAMLLEMNGYEVQQARDGHEALRLARDRMPDLAVCDVVLPQMMGWELCQRLKAMSAPRHLPVIMLTAKATELDEVRSYEAAADDHFTKPPDMKALLKTIGAFIAEASKAK